MTDNNAFESFVAGHLADDGSGTAQAERVAALIHESTGDARQRPRWLALIKEPPMRVSSKVAVGSPTVRVAAIMAATLLLAIVVAAAGVAGSRLLAADGAIVVDQSGGGDYTTIGDAVAAAADGDTIRVRPGTYDESVLIEGAITIEGDGPREEVILTFDGGGITPDDLARDSLGSLLRLRDSDAVISDLTLTGEGTNVWIRGGAPVLRDIHFDGLGMPHDGDFATNGALGGPNASFFRVALDMALTTPTITGNTFDGGGEVGLYAGATALIEGNSLASGPSIFLSGAADGTVVRGNTIREPSQDGISIRTNGDYLIEENTIVGALEHGIEVGGHGATVRANEVLESDIGIMVWPTDALVDGNVIRDGQTGIAVSYQRMPTEGAPTVSGNDVEATGLGIDVGPDAVGTVTGNTVCGGESSIQVDETAAATVADNEVC